MRIAKFLPLLFQLTTCSVLSHGLAGVAQLSSINVADAGTQVFNSTEHDQSGQVGSPASINDGSTALEALRSVESVAKLDEAYWWMADKRFVHKSPFTNYDNYVLRNVKEWGAKGDGVTDDWAAIDEAMRAGGRCGPDCKSTTTKQAIVYFPPGTYRIKKPIQQYYYTTMVGHPKNRATIVGDRNFQGIALVDTDPYIEFGQWFDANNNFYRSIRNLNFDLREMPNHVRDGADGGAPAGIHWQNSQACSLQSLSFLMPQWQSGSEKPTHRGIFTENGSGGFVSDLTFDGGKYGFWLGSQQYTVRGLTFRNCGTAIRADWGWGTTYKNLKIENCDVGIDASGGGGAGGLSIIDSTFDKVGKPIVTAGPFTDGDGKDHSDSSIVLDNVIVGGATNAVVSTKYGVTLLDTNRPAGQSIYWTHGNVYRSGSLSLQKDSASLPQTSFNRPRGLVSGNNEFFSRDQPQYEDLGPNDFLNVLDFGANNDDHWLKASNTTKAINAALRASVQQGKVLVFPAGIYLVDDTIFVPTGARLVGAAWAQIAATGPKFANPQTPRVVVRVGNPGDKGRVEISDLTISQSGPTAGAIFMQWNVHEDAQGSAAMWNVVVRVGGAKGTEISKDICASDKQKANGQVSPECMAGTMMLHVTKQASIYMDNSWFWVADHDLDDKDQTTINVYNGRGILMESQGPSWIYGVSNEHSTLYNWQLSGAKNIFMGHVQSETPYFQGGSISSLVPYTPNPRLFPSDPDFHACEALPLAEARLCRSAWAMRIINSSNVYMYGGGFYSFFVDNNNACSNAKTGSFKCQDKLMDVSNSTNVQLFNLFTVGAPNIVSAEGGQQLAKMVDNPSANRYATSVAAWLWGMRETFF